VPIVRVSALCGLLEAAIHHRLVDRVNALHLGRDLDLDVALSWKGRAHTSLCGPIFQFFPDTHPMKNILFGFVFCLLFYFS
jgi:hypothetical protein